jgi:hypothetical protein
MRAPGTKMMPVFSLFQVSHHLKQVKISEKKMGKSGDN